MSDRDESIARKSGHPEHYDARWLAGAHQSVRGMLARLPWWLSEFLIFGFKQAWACLFGGAMLGLAAATLGSAARSRRPRGNLR